MQFWSGTAFLDTADELAVTRMLDETGYDGMICADHLIYPRNLTSPYPGARAAPRRGGPGDGVARFVGHDRRDGGRDHPTLPFHQRGLHRAVTSTAGGGQAGRHCGSDLRRDASR